MALPEPLEALTVEDYLAIEEQTGVRHEWINGVAYAMAGGSAEHSAIKTNLTGLLFMHLRGGSCRAADSDQRVHVVETGSSFYADLAVVCGAFEFASSDEHAVTNPTVLFEVLSESTADHDRGTKFQHYRRIRTLRAYVLISQDEQRVEIRERVEEGWLVREITEGELAIAALSMSVAFDELYDLAGVRHGEVPRVS